MPSPPPLPSLLQFGSLAYLVVGLLWTVAAVVPLLDEALAASYRKVPVLPTLKLPYQSPEILGLPAGLVPEFNLFYLAPAFLAILSFLAMESLGTDRWTPYFYIPLVSGVSIAATMQFVVGQPASAVILAFSAIAAATALAGRAQYQRR